MKICQVGAVLFHVDGWMDGQTGITKLSTILCTHQKLDRCPCSKSNWNSGVHMQRYSSAILNLGTKWKVVSYMPWPPVRKKILLSTLIAGSRVGTRATLDSLEKSYISSPMPRTERFLAIWIYAPLVIPWQLLYMATYSLVATFKWYQSLLLHDSYKKYLNFYIFFDVSQ